MKDFEKSLAKCLPEHTAVLRRSVAVKIVLMGFTCLDQVASTHVDDIKEFLPSPAQREAFVQVVKFIDMNVRRKRQRQDGVLSTL